MARSRHIPSVFMTPLRGAGVARCLHRRARLAYIRMYAAHARPRLRRAFFILLPVSSTRPRRSIKCCAFWAIDIRQTSGVGHFPQLCSARGIKIETVRESVPSAGALELISELIQSVVLAGDCPAKEFDVRARIRRREVIWRSGLCGLAMHSVAAEFLLWL